MATSCQDQAESTLDSNNLVDIIDILEKCGLSNTRWLDLGLRLGLLKRTLDEIEANYSNANRRLTECLMKWLSKADNVVNRGGPPTWDSLSAALRAIKEIAVADKLDTEKRPQQTAIHHSSHVPSPVTGHTKATPNDHEKCSELQPMGTYHYQTAASKSEVSTHKSNSGSKPQATCHHQTAVSINIVLVGSIAGTAMSDKECFPVSSHRESVTEWPTQQTATCILSNPHSSQLSNPVTGHAKTNDHAVLAKVFTIEISTQTSNSGSKLQPTCTCHYQTAVSKSEASTQIAVSKSEASTQIAVSKSEASTQTSNSGSKLQAIRNYQTVVSKKPRNIIHVGSTASTRESDKEYFPVSSHCESVTIERPTQQTAILSNPHISNPVTGHAKATPSDHETLSKLQANYQTAVSTKQTEKRNILVIGRTSAGCSTVGNQLLGKEVFRVIYSPSSVHETKMVGVSEFEYDGTRYEFTVIDAIGWFDTPNMIFNVNNFRKAINRHVDGLHLVVFVMKEGRFTREQKHIFDIICSKDIDPISMLVITGCEGKDKAVVVKGYQSNPVTREAVNHMKKGVYPVGFPDLKQCSEPLKSLFKMIVDADAAMLRKRAIECGEKIPLEKLFPKMTFPWSILFS